MSPLLATIYNYQSSNMHYSQLYLLHWTLFTTTSHLICTYHNYTSSEIEQTNRRYSQSYLFPSALFTPLRIIHSHSLISLEHKVQRTGSSLLSVCNDNMCLLRFFWVWNSLPHSWQGILGSLCNNSWLLRIRTSHLAREIFKRITCHTLRSNHFYFYT